MAPEGEPESDDPESGDGEGEVYGLRVVAVGPDAAGARLDKTLAALLPEFSRARLQALIAEGRVSRAGAPATDGSAKATAGDYRIEIPPPVATTSSPQSPRHGPGHRANRRVETGGFRRRPEPGGTAPEARRRATDYPGTRHCRRVLSLCAPGALGPIHAQDACQFFRFIL